MIIIQTSDLHLSSKKPERIKALENIISKAIEKKADLLLCPPVRQFSLTGVKEFEKIVESGYQFAKTELVKWLETYQEQSKCYCN